MTAQYSGALGANQDLVDAIAQAWGYVLPGATIQGMSGLRAGGRETSQHYTGDAWDYGVTRADGTPVRWNDPEVAIAAEIAASMGLLGFGWGGSYMGGNYFHFDNGQNPHAPRAGVTVWSDDDGGASDSGPGAAQYGDRLRAAAGMPLADVLAMHGLGEPDPLYGGHLGFPRSTSQPSPGPVRSANALAGSGQTYPQRNALIRPESLRPEQRENVLDPAAFAARPLQANALLPFVVPQ